ncbi:MAG: hypothetical protein K2P83_08820 [Nitrosomonas sp.]|nr:hypothetical protein [Nitrosomonas sp.]
MRIVGEKHYIINAMKNSSVALGMSLELWANKGTHGEGVQELVTIINAASIQLKNICRACENKNNNGV